MEDDFKPGRYRHFKGNEYELLFLATNSETRERMVVYRALYGEGGLWVRPAAMWNETVERDGVVAKRFTYVGDASCPCKKERCARHGDCSACQAHHAGMDRPVACERTERRGRRRDRT